MNATSAAPATAAAYGARNVLNAPQIKASIAERSAARNDSSEIAQWLGSHFYRHVVGNLNAGADTLVHIDSLQAAQQRLGPQLPDWVVKHLQASPGKPLQDESRADASQALWWIAPQGPEVLALETRLVEFLRTRRGTSLEGKLMRVNAPQALAQWEAEHRAFEALQQAGWRTHQPEAVTLVWQGDHGSFVEFKPNSPHLRAELAYESQCMRHCVGQFANRKALSGGYGEHYANACEAGEMRLFSYRSQGLAQQHITLSAHVLEDGQLEIEQIKGKQNRPPVPKYKADVLGFLRSLPTRRDSTPPDALGMNLICLASGWTEIEAIVEEKDQLALLRTQPDKVGLLRHPSALVQWLSLAAAPDSLTESFAADSALAQTLQLADQTERPA